MSFTRAYPNKNSVDIELNRLIAFSGYPLELFMGKRFTDMVDNIRANGVCKPIIVRPAADGKYEILNGHYRVAAAKKLGLNTVPTIIREGLTDEQALLFVSDTDPLGLMVKHGIDIYDSDYKKSEHYRNIEDSRVFSDDSFSMALDEYVERLLLTEHELFDNYESIYDMGNPYELNDEECEYTDVAREIIRILPPDEDDGKAKRWKKAERSVDIAAAIEADKEEVANELAKTFIRPGGYVDQLKKHLKLDLSSFDYSDIRNKREKAKILYFVYMLKNRHFPKSKILELLSKPSMENIDNSFLGRETSNGRFIKLIKHSLEMELSLDGRHSKDNIKGLVTNIEERWGKFIDKARMGMDYLSGYGYEYDFDGVMNFLKPTPEELSEAKGTATFKFAPLSPIETLYLRLLQHELIGQMKDILMVHNLQTDSAYHVPLEYVDDMIVLHSKKIKISGIEAYVQDKPISKRIAPYVYLKPMDDPLRNKGKYEAIRHSKDKVRRFIDFCSLAEPYTSTDDEVSELMIISCLQAIMLDDKNEIFDYAFHGFEGKKGKRKGKIHVPAALKNDNHTPDALQVYWVRKVVDRWYANIGRYESRCKLRELEKLCVSILSSILECPDINEMFALNNFYWNRLAGHSL